MPDLIIPAAISSQLDESGEERIHVANVTTVVRSQYVPNLDDLWLSYSGDTVLRTSGDGSDWTTVDSGGFVSQSSAATRVHFAGGQVFRMGTGGVNRSRTSLDGLSWSSLTGLSFTGAVETLIKPATEWLFFQSSSSDMGYSTDGIAVSTRALGTTLQDGRMAIKGSTILGMSTTANTIARSTDNGATWGTVSLGGVTTASAFPLATTNRFLIFGQKLTDDTNFVKWSTTGAAASWTEVSIPGSLAAQRIRQATFNPDTGRIILVRADYAVYYSDDEGSTWSAASAFPNLSGDTFASGTNVFLFGNSRCYLVVYASDNTESRVYTTVGGTSWTQIYSELTDGSGGVLVNLAIGDF